MIEHTVKCDECKKKVKLEWNSAHWLTPRGWVTMYCETDAATLNSHLCPDCKPKIHPHQSSQFYTKDAE
jgi:hypothetical protein